MNKKKTKNQPSTINSVHFILTRTKPSLTTITSQLYTMHRIPCKTTLHAKCKKKNEDKKNLKPNKRNGILICWKILGQSTCVCVCALTLQFHYKCKCFTHAISFLLDLLFLSHVCDFSSSVYLFCNIQRLMHSQTNGANNKEKKLELVPCCTATQFSSLDLLYVESNTTATRKTLPNMVVEACGCLWSAQQSATGQHQIRNWDLWF